MKKGIEGKIKLPAFIKWLDDDYFIDYLDEIQHFLIIKAD